jgi:hypothetical protein
LTVTTTSTTTAFVAAAQVTTTTTTTTTLPVPTVYTGETTQFQLVTSTNDILYLASADTNWYYEANNPATYSPGFYLYNILGGVLRSSSTDCLEYFGAWGTGDFCSSCTLDANLRLQCDIPFYKSSDSSVVYTSSDGAYDGSAASDITAIPYCPTG